MNISQLSSLGRLLLVLVCFALSLNLKAQNHVGIGTLVPGYTTGYSILSINSSDGYAANRTSLLELKGSSNEGGVPKGAVRFLSHTGDVVGEIGSYGAANNYVSGGSMVFSTTSPGGLSTYRMQISHKGIVSIGNEVINAFDTSAILDVQSTTKGMLIPRMTTSQRAAIGNPENGLLVYDTSNDAIWHYQDGWQQGIGSYSVIDQGNSEIRVTDTGPNGVLSFTLDNTEMLRIEKNATGIYRFNTALQSNLFFGLQAGLHATDVLFGNNTAFGNYALDAAGFSGTYNSAFGSFALSSNTAGDQNSAFGRNALYLNTTGDGNSAMGHSALSSATGEDNTAVGAFSLQSLEGGSGNVALGYGSGSSDDAGSHSNVYLGRSAGSKVANNSSVKNRNVMIGFEAGSLAEGDDNVFIGYRAGMNETGDDKLYIDNTNTNNPLIYGDFSANTLKTNGTLQITGNVGIGVEPGGSKLEVAGAVSASSGLVGSHTALRAQGAEAVWYNGTFFSWGFGGQWNRFADSVRIGGATSPSHLLMVDGVARSTQSTWATSSDARVKENIRTVENALETLRRFRPVIFDWTDDYASVHTSLHNENYGFIAQEVEQIIPSMVTTVRETVGDTSIEDFKVLSTDALIPLLVKSVQEQDTIISSLQSQLAHQQTQIDALMALLNRSDHSASTIRLK